MATAFAGLATVNHTAQVEHDVVGMGVRMRQHRWSVGAGQNPFAPLPENPKCNQRMRSMNNGLDRVAFEPRQHGLEQSGEAIELVSRSSLLTA